MHSLSTQRDFKAVFLGNRSIAAWVVCLSTTVIGACAAIAPASPEEAVRARAQERWDLLVKGELVKAYDYYSAGSRLGFSREDFAAGIRRGFWTEAKVTNVECRSAETCEVEVMVKYQFKGIPGGSPLRETWVRDAGQWWYLRK